MIFALVVAPPGRSAGRSLFAVFFRRMWKPADR